MERFTKPIPEGRVCLWYKGGDLNRKPLLAMVTDDEHDGILKLAVLGPNWAHHICYSGVRHKDDPHLKERPQQAKDNGCWDYLPVRVPGSIPATVKEPEPSKDLAPLTDEIKNQIAELLGKGSNSVEIATVLTAITGDKWTHQRVNAIVRSMKQVD